MLFFMLALPAPAAVAAALAGMGLRLRAGGRVCRFRLQEGKGQADIQVDSIDMKAMREELKAVERLRKAADQLARQERDKPRDRGPER